MMAIEIWLLLDKQEAGTLTPLEEIMLATEPRELVEAIQAIRNQE